MSDKKTVKVAAAIIFDGDKILATKREHGNFKGFWEFPGGKQEEGELIEETLRREIREEIGKDIKIIRLFHNVKYEYDTFFLDMDCFLCEFKDSMGYCSNHQKVKYDLNEENGGSPYAGKELSNNLSEKDSDNIENIIFLGEERDALGNRRAVKGCYVNADTIDMLKWLPADYDLIEKIKSELLNM